MGAKMRLGAHESEDFQEYVGFFLIIHVCFC